VKILTVFCQIVVLFSVTLTGNSLSSTSSMQSAPVGVGDMAPEFTLEDQNHNKVALSDARGHSPVVLVFYRGYW
jgi:peroxiredoxin